MLLVFTVLRQVRVPSLTPKKPLQFLTFSLTTARLGPKFWAILGSALLGVTLPGANPSASADSPALDRREVWVQVVLTKDFPPPDTESIRASVQAALDQFGIASRGTFRAEVTKISDPIQTDAEDCSKTFSFFRPNEMGGTMVPRGTHMVTVISGECFYAGQAPAGIGDWMIVSGLKSDGTLPVGTIVHEFGHNLGLAHANGWSCFAQSQYSKPAAALDQAGCYEVEYGDVTDVMGNTSNVMSTNFLHALNWGGIEQSIPLDGKTHVVSISPGGQGVDRVLLPGGYSLSFAPMRGVGQFKNGVLLHDLQLADKPPTGGYFPRAESMLVPMSKFATGALPGMHLILPGGYVAFQVLDMSDDSSRVMILTDPSGGIHDTFGPSLAASVTTEAKKAGREWLLSLYWTAFDPAGVQQVIALIGGRALTLRHVPGVSPDYLTITTERLPRRVIITAIDGLGNPTTVRLRTGVKS